MYTPDKIINEWLNSFENALISNDLNCVLLLFNKECYWRDLISFTWDIKTFEGKYQIKDMLDSSLIKTQPKKWKLQGNATEENGVIQGFITFETQHSLGEGYVRLKDGKCWTLLTSMTELRGHKEKSGLTRDIGVHHQSLKNRKSWLEHKLQLENELGYTKQPYCLIIGGGQGGIALGARLKQLNVPTIIIEKNERAGDSWRNRYQSLCLHDPVWADHLPYIPFPEHWPVFSPKDKLADWLEAYTKIMELNYWNSSECTKAIYNEDKQEWDVTVNRSGKIINLHPKQLIIATGMSGIPFTPEFMGASTFKGKQCHSSKYDSGKNHVGKKCIVLGSNNSAHDICADLYEQGADVTMIQSSATTVLKSDTLLEYSFSLYSEKSLKSGITTHMADLIFASIPYKVMADFQIKTFKKVIQKDADFYASLKNSGFQYDFGEDQSGSLMKYLRRGSGYYFNVGASELIIDGHIKLKSGVNILNIKENSIVLTDNSELPADLIVYATGYGPMNDWVTKLISKETADRVGLCWGLGSDTRKDPGPWVGELRNMWKPTNQPGLWFHGGSLQQSRYYSKVLALQLKARMEGIVKS